MPMRVILLIITFIIGWSVNGVRYEYIIQNYINEELKHQIQAVEDARSKEQEYREKLDKTTRQAKEAIDVVNAHYRKLLNDSLSKSSASSQNSMSANAKTSGTVQTNANKCVRTDTAEFQRLYQKQLALAKQCDELNVKYVRLYDLYQQLTKPTMIKILDSTFKADSTND